MSVPARARIVLLLTLVLPLSVSAALININTADVATLDTLPSIGPTKAQAIVDYRTANGPFARIEDIKNVSGIGDSIYADIAPYITVGEASQPTIAATSTAPIPAPSTYVPPPSSLAVDAGPDRTLYLNVRASFSASVRAKGSESDPGARIYWSFGDGSSAEGSTAEKTYRYPGTYVVTATAVNGVTRARDTVVVTVESLPVRIASITDAGILLENSGREDADLSGWRLTSGTGMFLVPLGTTLLPGTTLFPFAVTNLPVSYEVALSFPDGVRAASYTPPVQLPPAEERSQLVQAPEPAGTSFIPTVAYETEVVEAPAAATEIAAAGAALPEERSPWLWGLMGAVLLAGSVFVLL